MKKLISEIKLTALSAVFASSMLLSPFVMPVSAATGEDIQCIADQHYVGENGRISYHILYHNVTNKNGSHTWLKVKVPNELEIDGDDLGGAEWDAQNAILSWRIKDDDKGAGVFHFNLKVKSGVPAGSLHQVSCILEEDGKVREESPVVVVESGSQIDQPFFTGYPDGGFHPERALTRAEAATVVARILNLTYAAPTLTYSDVDSGHWAFNNINKVTDAGYMRGYQDGSFHPDDPITRAELVALVLRIRGVHEIPIDSNFSDEKGHWAEHTLGTAKALNWIHGVGNGRFDADAPVLRNVAAVLFDTALERGPLTDGATQVIQHFPDVTPGTWSYNWVEEASKVAHEGAYGPDGLEHLIRYLPDQTQSF